MGEKIFCEVIIARVIFFVFQIFLVKDFNFFFFFFFLPPTPHRENWDSKWDGKLLKSNPPGSIKPSTQSETRNSQ